MIDTRLAIHNEHATIVVGENGRIVRANDMAEHLFGYAISDLKNAELENLLPRVSRGQHETRRQFYFGSPPRRGDSISGEFVASTSRGERLPADVSIEWMIEDGIRYAVATIRPVTPPAASEQHSLKSQLVSAESRLRSLVSLSSDCFWQSDADHRFTSMFGHNEETRLHSVENVLGKTRFELGYEWENEQAMEQHRKLLAERKPFRNILLHNPKNDRFSLTSGEPVFDETGSFIGYQGVSRDITSEKRAERNLRRNEARFRALTALSHDWYWEQDTDLRFTVFEGVNEKADLATVENTIGRTRFELPYVWASPEARAEHERALEQRESFHDLLLHNPENGRFALVSGQPMFDDNGVFTGYQGVSRDVTNEKLSELALKERETRFRALTELSADWYWEQDADLRFTFISGANDETHLDALEQVIGKTRLELPYIWKSPETRAEHERILAERKPFRDLLLQNPENDRFALITGEPVFDAGGIFRGYQGVGRDITEQKRRERELRDSESRFRALTELSADWYWEQDSELRFTFVSGVNDATHLTPVDQVIGKTRFELDYVWESPAARIEHERALVDHFPFRDLMLHNPENDRFALVTGEPVFGIDGVFQGYQGVSRDITEQKRSERAVRESEARFRALTALSSDWYWEQDAEFRFTYLSPTTHNRAQLKIGSIIGHTPFELPLVWESETAKQKHREILEGCLPFRDLLLSTLKGDQYVLVSGEPVFDDGGQLKGYRGIAKDVTARKSAEAQALRLATHDSLTALPNRTLMADRIDRAIGRARRKGTCIAVLFIDLDRFKTLNDSSGHDASDELLRKLSARLDDALRETDSLCRFGGDEFVALLEDIEHVSDIEAIAEKILAVVSAPFDVRGISFQTTASIGISVSPADSEKVDVLLRNADLAMYEVKATGRGRFRFYDDEMNKRVAARVQLDRDLRRAVRESEFDVFLQPQFDINTGATVGAEALLRWYHPTRGIVLPSEFMYAAEDSGLILPIGQFVIERTLRMIADWLKGGITPPRIAINISPRQLLDGTSLLKHLDRVLEDTRVPPALFEFEITESLLIPDGDSDTRRILETLGQMGVRLAIDDFGTGYSSLSYLKQLPVHAIKIDRAFITDIDFNEENVAIVRAVLGIARSMSLEVVCEGVESERQLAALREIGCDSYQGFLRSEPVPRCQFEKTILSSTKRRVARCHPRCNCNLSLQSGVA